MAFSLFRYLSIKKSIVFARAVWRFGRPIHFTRIHTDLSIYLSIYLPEFDRSGILNFKNFSFASSFISFSHSLSFTFFPLFPLFSSFLFTPLFSSPLIFPFFLSLSTLTSLSLFFISPTFYKFFHFPLSFFVWISLSPFLFFITSFSRFVVIFQIFFNSFSFNIIFPLLYFYFSFFFPPPRFFFFSSFSFSISRFFSRIFLFLSLS
ncbi:unnamed protein product [Acanthosepion pharaonis]|uniref:Uncharacterized protein n=1 Tax=Acanthosepion pharaonis TaxID=158019 RepID=A0A812ECD0_ACAPH|nr:unnamed protein product [Sepia pharaonis]